MGVVWDGNYLGEGRGNTYGIPAFVKYYIKLTSTEMNWTKMKRMLVWPLLTIVVYGILRNVLYAGLIPLIWDYLDIQEGQWLNVSIVMTAVLLLIFGWTNKRDYYSANHLGVFLSVLTLLLLFGYDNDTYPFLNVFDRYPIWPILVSSFVIGIITHHIFDWICRYNSNRKALVDEEFLLFQDLPIKDLNEDKLAFGKLAKRIASSIIKFDGRESFSIGITGIWGAGKTTLLNFVKDDLKDRSDIIAIDFSPRLSSSIQDIQKDFLNELGDRLAKCHSGAQRVTEKYMRAIGALPGSLWAARVFGIVWDQEIEEQRKEMISVINEIKKKIVVFVDDFDRLTGEEIQEVFKLIDKNAAFPGTFFITAYDKAQTNSVIASYLNEIDKNRDYTDKYFNLEVSVPLRYTGRYVKILRESLYSLSDRFMIRSSHKEIDDALPRLYPFMSKYLSTVRDIKRYLNLVSLHLPPVENDVLLGDFLLTTLIGFKFPDEYVKLARHEYVVLKGNIPSDAKTYALNIHGSERVKSMDILAALFSDTKAKKGYRSVTHKNSFDQYFYDYDSRDLKFKDLSQILNPTISEEEFKIIIRPWMNDGRMKSDLIEFVLSYEKSIHSFDSAKRYLRMFFLTRTYCESSDLYIATLSYLLAENLEDNLKLFNIHSEKEYRGFFRSALRDMFELPLSVESIHDALHAVNILDSRGEPKLIFTSDELMDVAREKLTKAIQLVPEGLISNWEIFRFLRACVVEYIPDIGESIDSNALEMVKNAIKEHPSFFLKDVLCHKADEKLSSTIHLQFISGFPYFDLFKSYEGLQDFIKSLPDDIDKILTNCLSQYADYCVIQKTWTPSLLVNGDISQIKQGDYLMYNKLFEGEPVDA